MPEDISTLNAAQVEGAQPMHHRSASHRLEGQQSCRETGATAAQGKGQYVTGHSRSAQGPTCWPEQAAPIGSTNRQHQWAEGQGVWEDQTCAELQEIEPEA